MIRARLQGFTLIELLVVIAIIGILSSVVLSSLNSARGRSRYTQALAQMREIRTAAEAYFADNGVYPPDAGIGVMPTGLSPYIATWPSPPCGNLVYDWNNFSGGTNVHVDLRTVSPSASVANFCIYASSGTCAGTNILNLSPKELAC